MSDDLDIMEFDDDELSFDDSSFDVSMDEPKDDRNPIAVARDNVLSSVKDDMTNPARLTSIVRENLPSGYSSAVTAVDSSIAGTRELYNDAVKEVGPAVRDLKRQTKRALPRMKAYMPESWYEKAEKFLTDRDEDAVIAQQSADDSAIASSLASIFEQQNETERTEKLEQTASDAIDKKVDEVRHKESANLQVGIINRLQQMIDFNNQINSKVSRQGLELQFRSYFTLRDLLEVTKRTSEDTITHLSDIVKNTGLPDLLKHKPSENALQMLEDSIYGKRVEDAVGLMEPFVNKLKGKAKERFKNAMDTFKSGLEQGSEMLGGINDANEAMADMPGGGMGISDIAATMIAGNITERLSGFAGRGVRKVLDRDPTTNNANLEAGFSDLDGLVARLSQADPGEDVRVGSTKVPKFIQRFVRFFGEGEGNRVTQQVGEAVTNIRGKETDAVSYDVMSRKTLVEIIPYYLREQLSQLDILNGGSGEKHVYNPSKGRMDTMRSAVKDIRREAFNPEEERGRLDTIKQTVDEIDKDENLSRMQRRKLAEIINTTAKDGTNFDAIELIGVLEDSGDPETVEMAAQLREVFGITEDGNVTDAKSTIGKLTRIGKRFAQVRSSYTGSRQKLLGDYARSGSNELLAEAGLLKDDGSRRGSANTYNSAMANKFRTQVLRTMFRGEVGEDDGVAKSPIVGGADGESASGQSTPPMSPDGGSTPASRIRDLVSPNKGSRPNTLRRNNIPDSGLTFGSGRPKRNNETYDDLSWSPEERAAAREWEESYRDSQGEEPAFKLNPLLRAMRAASRSDELPAFPVRPSRQEEATQPTASPTPAQRARSVANYGQGANAMQQGYGSEQVNITRTDPSTRPSHVLDTSALRDRGETSAITIRDGVIEVHNGQDALGDVAVERRRDEARKEEEDKGKEELSADSVTVVDHLKELIAANSQGFVDVVEAVMASSPNDEEIRDRYFGNLRERIGARMRGVGSMLGGTFKGALNIASVPYKAITGTISGIRDAIRGESDIYVKGEDGRPALTVAKMQRGLYRNEEGEVLTSLRNIDSPVYEDGNQALTAAQIDKGIYTKSKLGKAMGKIGDKAKGAMRRRASQFFGNTVGKAYNFAKNRVKDVNNFAKKLGNRHLLRRDLYLRGMLDKPKLTYAKLLAGEYFHPDTGEVLSSFSQITKGVKDRSGNWLLEPIDLKSLVDINGRAVKIRGAIMSMFRVASKPIRMVTDRVAKAAKYVNNKAMERLNTDIYVYQRGEGKQAKLVPKLYHDALKRGEYYNQADDGSIGLSLRSFAEIRGPIVDSSNKIKLTAEEIKAGLFDKNGKRLILAGTVMYLAKSAKNLVMTPARKVFNMVKGAGEWLFGGDEMKGKESLLGKISNFFGGLRRPKIETMKVTTDIVYINGRNVLGGGGLANGVKSAKDIIKQRTAEMKQKGRSVLTGTSASRINSISAMSGVSAGRAGMTGDNISGRIGSAQLGRHAQQFNENRANSVSGRLGKLKDRVSGFSDKLTKPKIFDDFGKAFKFNWDSPNAVKNFQNLSRRIKVMGTRKQRLLLKRLEKRLKRDGSSLLSNPFSKGNRERLKGKLGDMRESLTGTPYVRPEQSTKTLFEYSKQRKKSGDSDGDGMRDGGWREEAKEKAKGMKDLALKLFRRKQVKQGDEQISLLGKLLKSMKKTEKNTKDTANGDSGFSLASLLGAAGGGGLGAGLLAKVKGMFGGKAAQTAGKEVAKKGAQTAAKSVGRSLLTRAAFAVGRTAVTGIGTALAGILGVGVGTVVAVGAAAGAIGYGGYQAYKYNQRRSEVNPVERHRFISYGLNPDNEDELVAIRYLEDELEGEVTPKGFKDPITEIIADYAEDFGIEDDDGAGLKRFGEWLAGRFLPVFASWTLGAERMGVDLDDVYDDLERKQYVDLAKAVYFRKGESRNPYAILESPFEGRVLADRSKVRESLNALIDGDGDSKAKDKKKPVSTEINTGKVRKEDLAEKIRPKEVGEKSTKSEQAKSIQAKAAQNRKELGMRGNWTLDEFMDPANMTAEDQANTLALARQIQALNPTDGKPVVEGMSDDEKVAKTESAKKILKDNIKVEDKPTLTARKPRNDIRNRAVRRARKRKLAMQRMNFVKQAVINGESTELPSHLAGASEMELARLQRQADIWTEKKQQGLLEKSNEPLPSKVVQEQQNRESIRKRREERVAKVREAQTSGKLSSDEYTVQMQERHYRTTLNMDNTLYHMYSILEERLPLPEDDERMAEAMARREERRAEMKSLNTVNVEEKKRTPPAPVMSQPDVNPVSFEKNRQQRI